MNIILKMLKNILSKTNVTRHPVGEYKYTGERMLLATLLATNKCVGGQMY